MFKRTNWPSHICQEKTSVKAGNPYWRGSLSTVNLLFKITCFLRRKNIFFVFRAARLKYFVKGGGPYTDPSPSIRVPWPKLHNIFFLYHYTIRTNKLECLPLALFFKIVEPFMGRVGVPLEETTWKGLRPIRLQPDRLQTYSQKLDHK